MKNKALSIALLAAVVVCLLGSTASAFPGPPLRMPGPYGVTPADPMSFFIVAGAFIACTIFMALPVSPQGQNSTSITRVSEEIVATQQETQRQLTEVLEKLDAIETQAKAAAEERRALIESHAAIVRARLEAIAKIDGKAADAERERLVHELISLIPDLNGDEIDRLLTPTPAAQA